MPALAYVGFNPGPFGPVHRVAAGTALFSRRWSNELANAASLRRVVALARPPVSSLARQAITHTRVTAELIGASGPDESAEVFLIVLVGKAGAWIVYIGEPFHCCRYGGQLLEPDDAQPAFAWIGVVDQRTHRSFHVSKRVWILGHSVTLSVPVSSVNAVSVAGAASVVVPASFARRCAIRPLSVRQPPPIADVSGTRCFGSAAQ